MIFPWVGSINEAAAGFASAAVDLYSKARDWTRAQSNGFTILRTRFDRREHEQFQIDRIDEARKELLKRRDNNFVGAMLRDHHHRSTRYFSQWIEAKNQHAGGKLKA